MVVYYPKILRILCVCISYAITLYLYYQDYEGTPLPAVQAPTLHPEKARSSAPLEFPRRSILERFRGISGLRIFNVTFGINIAQNPYTIGSLGPKALKYKSFEGKVIL